MFRGISSPWKRSFCVTTRANIPNYFCAKFRSILANAINLNTIKLNYLAVLFGHNHKQKYTHFIECISLSSVSMLFFFSFLDSVLSICVSVRTRLLYLFICNYWIIAIASIHYNYAIADHTYTTARFNIYRSDELHNVHSIDINMNHYFFHWHRQKPCRLIFDSCSFLFIIDYA